MATIKNPIHRVLNTTEEIVEIPRNMTQSENLSGFNIYTMNKIKPEKERGEKLSKMFKENAPKHCHDKLLPLLQKYSDIFALATDKMTQNNSYEQTIRLNDETPVYSKNYRLPQTQKVEINRQIDKLIENDLIEPSKSSYNSPVILVPKKSNDNTKKWRMCIDYIK